MELDIYCIMNELIYIYRFRYKLPLYRGNKISFLLHKTKEFVVFQYFTINKRMHFKLIGFRMKWWCVRYHDILSESVHPEFFLAFVLRVCSMGIMVNNHYCRVFTFVVTHIIMLSDGLLDFFLSLWLNVIVDSPVEVTCSQMYCFRPFCVANVAM